jgi:hypothetical protein
MSVHELMAGERLTGSIDDFQQKEHRWSAGFGVRPVLWGFSPWDERDLLVDLIHRPIEQELHVPAQGQPGTDLGMSAQQLEIFLGSELNPTSLSFWQRLDPTVFGWRVRLGPDQS